MDRNMFTILGNNKFKLFRDSRKVLFNSAGLHYWLTKMGLYETRELLMNQHQNQKVYWL